MNQEIKKKNYIRTRIVKKRDIIYWNKSEILECLTFNLIYHYHLGDIYKIK
jgi:hypothetical protein